jgi:hypothetical protein
LITGTGPPRMLCPRPSRSSCRTSRTRRLSRRPGSPMCGSCRQRPTATASASQYPWPAWQRQGHGENRRQAGDGVRGHLPASRREDPLSRRRHRLKPVSRAKPCEARARYHRPEPRRCSDHGSRLHHHGQAGCPQVREAALGATILASHMEAMNHGMLSRKGSSSRRRARRPPSWCQRTAIPFGS